MKLVLIFIDTGLQKQLDAPLEFTTGGKHWGHISTPLYAHTHQLFNLYQ